MPGNEGPSPTHVGNRSKGTEESSKAVYFVPIYALTVVDPNNRTTKRHLLPEGQGQKIICSDDSIGAGGLVVPSKGIRSKFIEPEAAIHHKRQKLTIMRRRGKIPVCDEDDPHKPTPKRLRNRMKAQKSRDKKKAYLTALESKVDELMKLNSNLEEKCNALQIENELMKNEILDVDFAAGKEKVGQCDNTLPLQEKEEDPFLEKSEENFVAESLDDEEVRGTGTCFHIDNQDCQAELTTKVQDCALEDYICGRDAEASPSTYIEDDGQFAHRFRISSERFSL